MDVRTICLGLLTRGEATGYEIKKQFEGEGFGHFAEASFGSIYPAVWSFQLALRSRGLGSAFTTLHLPFADQAAELLGIPDGVLQTALIPVAYFRGDDFQPAHRRPVEEITYWNGWKQPR